MQRLEKHALHCGPTGVHLSRVSFQASPDTSAYRFDFLAQGIQGRLAKEDCGVDHHTVNTATDRKTGSIGWRFETH